MNHAAGITVVFATHNGADTLPRMLDALEDLETPMGGVKIVAVDNASTDNSAALIKSRSTSLPVELLTETRRGKSAALNRALSAIEGDLVVLTDDDVVPRADWLIAIRRVAEQQPAYDIFGGAIFPIWESTPPDWLLRCVPKGYFAWTDFKDGPIEPSRIWGPNMAVRSAIFRDHRFFEGIGPDGTRNYAVGSETEFARRAVKSGHQCWHSEKSVVGHLICRHQMETEWLLQRAYNHARGWRRQRKLDNMHNQASTPGRGPFVTGEIVNAQLDLMHKRIFGSFEDQFLAKLRLRSLQGDLAERRSWHSRPNSFNDASAGS
jgi:GT2 family glycosyltransferase